MQTWYIEKDNDYQDVGWRQKPVKLFSYMDLDGALNRTSNEAAVAKPLDDTRGKSYMTTDYVDDQSWWGLAAAQGYELYANSTTKQAWLAASIAVFQDDMTRWSDWCGGGAVWKRSDPPKSSKNTITNTLIIALGARLHLLTGNSTFLDHAIKTYDWWYSWGLDIPTGKTWDTLGIDCKPSGNTLERMTYDSGMILGGLIDLAKGTKNQTYIATALSIANASIYDFSNNFRVMEEYCDEYGCSGDTIIFKAVLAQNLG